MHRKRGECDTNDSHCLEWLLLVVPLDAVTLAKRCKGQLLVKSATGAMATTNHKRDLLTERLCAVCSVANTLHSSTQVICVHFAQTQTIATCHSFVIISYYFHICLIRILDCILNITNILILFVAKRCIKSWRWWTH